MVNATHISFTADDRSYFSLIKKDIHKLVTEAGFPAVKVNSIDIIISELTSNLQKYTTGGAELLVGIRNENGNEYAELICIDNGPGISDVNKVLEDGYSSGNTMGIGFGSINRLSDRFDIYSQKGWGTIVLSRICKSDYKTSEQNMVSLNALVVAKPGETSSGDGYYFQQTKNGFKILISDGLGHGPEANIAVNEAVNAFKLCPDRSAVDLIRFIHNNIKKTRGIVANVILYDAEKRQWNLAGVGNISTKLMSGLNIKNFMSYNGIIGHNIPTTMNDVLYKQEDFNQFISCSDGIRSRWDAQKFPMIYKADPIILAAAIYKEFARKNDDMSVIVCKLVKA